MSCLACHISRLNQLIKWGLDLLTIDHFNLLEESLRYHFQLHAFLPKVKKKYLHNHSPFEITFFIYSVVGRSILQRTAPLSLMRVLDIEEGAGEGGAWEGALMDF